jgi:hypothetical protein
MSAVKTLAWSVAVWTGLSMVPAQADSISRSKGGWPWTAFWPAAAVNSYQATSAAPELTANPVPSPGLAPVTPIFAATPTESTMTNAALAQPTVVAPVLTSGPAIASPASTGAPADAFINLTSGPYPDSGNLTTGNAQPWYDSPSVMQAFGGMPNAQQQASFARTVLQDVQHTFQLSGMNPTLTIDPNAPAQHTLSVVSGTSFGPNPDAIGITNVGGNGFGFIDKLNYASNPTDLAWAVAHNISHELMHAFGIGYHPDGGNSVDAATANWAALIDPSMQFGPQATQLLLASQYGTLSDGTSGTGVGAELLNPGTKVDGDQELVVPAPEPATVAMWAFGALGGLMTIRRRSARPAA